MQRLAWLFVIFTLALSVTACTKGGAAGDNGPAGPQQLNWDQGNWNQTNWQ